MARKRHTARTSFRFASGDAAHGTPTTYFGGVYLGKQVMPPGLLS